jgi:vancomycin resistance protein YoaR
VPIKLFSRFGATNNSDPSDNKVSDASDEEVLATPDELSDTPDTSDEAYIENTTPSSRPWIGWIWKTALALVVVMLLAAGSFLYALDQQFAGRIYPNITIRGVSVGEMSEEQAQAAVQAQHEEFLAHPLTLNYGEHYWTPDLDELGVSLQVEQAVEQAYSLGRSPNMLTDIRQITAIWQQGVEIPLRLAIDEQTLQEYIAARAENIERPAINAQLVMQTTMPVAVPEVSGRQVLIEETGQEIIAALQTLQPKDVVVRTREILPPLSHGDISEVQREIDALLRESLVLIADEETVVWTPAQIAEMIQVRRNPGTETAEQPVVEIDHEQLRARINELADETATDGTLPRVDWNDGDLQVTEPGEPGQRIDVKQAETDILAALPTSDREVKLEFEETAPAINATNLDELGITELISVGRSDFTGSEQYRITNIQAGMRQFDGLLVPPGEEFSFNENVGAINSENGFVEGYAIVQNRTQLEWGGGICQDSTTMFRAAFWAGLPITERWGHSFYINWYDRYGYGEYGDGPGMDATIYTGPGGSDLRFLNDTGNWLLIQTHVDVDKTLAEVRIYGTDPGRTVEFEGPVIFNRTPPPPAPEFVPNPSIPLGTRYQSDTARGGMSISFTRIIKEDGVEVDREEFLTVFKPWPNIFEVNPADPIFNPPPPPPPPEEEETEEPQQEGEQGEKETIEFDPNAPPPPPEGEPPPPPPGGEPPPPPSEGEPPPPPPGGEPPPPPPPPGGEQPPPPPSAEDVPWIETADPKPPMP